MADFQSRWADFQKEGIGLLAASVESKDDAEKIYRELALEYPMAYGLDYEAFSRATGAFFEPTRKFIHATGFLLRPEGEIEVAAYSSGPIGRFTAADALMLALYYKSLKEKT